MKSLFFILLLYSLSIAENLHFRGDYEKAIEEARSEKKYLLVLLVQPHDKQIKTLIQTLYRQDIAKWLKEKCIIVIIVKGQQSYPVELLYTTQYPAYFLLNSDEVLLKGPILGDIDAELFKEEFMHKAAL